MTTVHVRMSARWSQQGDKMKSHPILFFDATEPERRVIKMPKTRAQREAETTRFLRWFGFWWMCGWLTLISIGLAWMSASGGR